MKRILFTILCAVMALNVALSAETETKYSFIVAHQTIDGVTYGYDRHIGSEGKSTYTVVEDDHICYQNSKGEWVCDSLPSCNISGFAPERESVNIPKLVKLEVVAAKDKSNRKKSKKTTCYFKVTGSPKNQHFAKNTTIKSLTANITYWRRLDNGDIFNKFTFEPFPNLESLNLTEDFYDENGKKNDGVTYLLKDCFSRSNFEHLKHLSISAPSLSKVHEGSYGSAFWYSELETIFLQSSVQVDLDKDLCEGCPNLRTFILTYKDADNETIHGVVGEEAFKNATNLEAVWLENIDVIDDRAFAGCTKLNDLRINPSDGRSVNRIGKQAFLEASIPGKNLVFDSSVKNWLSGVTVIGEQAFAATNIEQLSFLHYVPSTIGKEAFGNCKQLRSFTFDKMTDYDRISSSIVSTTESLDYFTGSTALTTITGYNTDEYQNWDLEGEPKISWAWSSISKQITSFTWKGPGSNCFPAGILANTTNLKKLTVERTDAEAYVRDSAFIESGITSFPIPIRYAGNRAFWQSGLESVTIGVAKDDPANWGVVIRQCAFMGAKLKSLVFKDAKYSFGNAAFDGNPLTYVNMQAIKQDWDDGDNRIPHHMFYECPIRTLVLPDNTKVIGEGAFYGNEIASISIPDAVTKIEEKAFQYLNDNIRIVRIGKKVATIGEDAFAHVDDKRNPDGKDQIIGLIWLSSDYKHGTLKYLFPSVETIYFGDTKDCCEDIPSMLCMYMPKLQTVAIPSGVKSIGEDAFNAVQGLTSISIPESCEWIGADAFYYDKQLTDISIPKSGQLKHIGKTAFKGTGTSISKSTFVIPENLQTLGAEAMPAHTATIDYYARKLETERPFDGYDQITDVMLHEGVEELPNGLFSGTGVSVITIPSTVKKLGYDLLVDGKNLGNNMKIYYNAKNAEYTPKYDIHDYSNIIEDEVKDKLWLLNPWGVEKIANVVTNLNYYDDFSGYDESTLAKMVDVVIGEGVERIPDLFFAGFRTHRHEFTVPVSVTSIGKDAFYGSDVRKVNAPQLKEVGTYAFCHADSLREIHLPEATIVETDGLAKCGNLTTVEIPKVEKYQIYAFSNDSNLTTVPFPSTLELINHAAFEHTGLTKCDLSTAKPGLKIGRYAFRDNHLTNLLLPEGTTMDKGSFANSGLTMMNLLNLTTAPKIESNTFDGIARDIPLYLNCDAKPSFDTDDYWKEFTNVNTRSPYSLTINPMPPTEEGTVTVTAPDCDNIVTLTAEGTKFFSFKQWSDGNTDNPRTILLTADMELGAEFEKTGSYTMRYLLFQIDEPSHGNITPDPSGWYAIEMEAGSDMIDNIELTPNDHYVLDFTSAIVARDKAGNVLNTPLTAMCQDEPSVGQCVLARLSLMYQDNEDLLDPKCSDTVYITIHTIGEEVMLRDWFVRNDDEAGVLCQYYDIEGYNYKLYNIYDRPGSYGETVQIYAHAGEGYAFTGWDDGVKDEIRTFTVGDRVHTANFEPLRLFVTFNTNLPQFATIGGQASYEKDYIYGDKVYLPAATDVEVIEVAGKFNHWEVNGSAEFETETDGEKIWLKNPIKEDLTITAVFDHKEVKMVVASLDNQKGTVAVSSDAPYHYGDQVTVTATPKSTNYILQKWSDGPAEAERVITLTQDTSLVAIFGENSYTVSLTIIPEGAASATGMGEYSFGDEFTLQVIPAEGYELKEWRNGTALEEKSNTLKGTVDGNLTIEAEFQLRTLTVLTEVNDAEAGIILGGGTFTYGTEIELTAKAFAHYVFAGWEDDATLPEKRTVKVTDNVTYRANFESEFVTVTVEADETMGKAQTSIEGEVPFGTELTLTATAFGGYEFTEWSDGNKDNPRTLTANKTQTLNALFAPKQYKVTIGEFDAKGGTVTLNHADGIYEYLETAEIIAEPAEGYIFVEWSNGDTEAEYCIIVQEDVTLTPKFAKDSGTGIDQTPTTNDLLPMTKKIIVDNQLYILIGDRIYDATGRLVK